MTEGSICRGKKNSTGGKKKRKIKTGAQEKREKDPRLAPVRGNIIKGNFKRIPAGERRQRRKEAPKRGIGGERENLATKNGGNQENLTKPNRKGNKKSQGEKGKKGVGGKGEKRDPKTREAAWG